MKKDAFEVKWENKGVSWGDNNICVILPLKVISNTDFAQTLAWSDIILNGTYWYIWQVQKKSTSLFCAIIRLLQFTQNKWILSSITSALSFLIIAHNTFYLYVYSFMKLCNTMLLAGSLGMWSSSAHCRYLLNIH